MFAAATALACVVVAGCHAPEPESPDVGLTKPIDPPQPPPLARGAARVSTEQHYNIWLSEVQNVCSGPSPIFDFDSASADADAKEQPTMQILARCMVTGPLRGKSIRLVGHTDPRGTLEDNPKLGLQRAERVKRYLAAHDVEPGRVLVDSVGEETASNAPADWPKDRRVEVRLVQ